MSDDKNRTDFLRKEKPQKQSKTRSSPEIIKNSLTLLQVQVNGEKKKPYKK